MDQKDIIKLIGEAAGGGVWADLGSGTGAFTLALRELGGPNIEILSVDKNEKSLEVQKADFDEKFPGSKIQFLAQNFEEKLNFSKLDGILMANSLHFIEKKEPFLDKIKNLLKPQGRLLIVEYDTDQANPYVPYPTSSANLQKLLETKGFKTRISATVPSRYQNRMYSLLANKF